MTDGSPEESEERTGRVDALLSGVRFGKFASVGAVGAGVDVGLLVILTVGFEVAPEIATLLSIECSILTMFAINERWTYAESGETGMGPLGRRLVRSHGVRAVGTAAHLLVFYFLLWNQFLTVTTVGIDFWPVLAKGSGIAAGVVFNYTFESLVTWQIHLE